MAGSGLFAVPDRARTCAAFSKPDDHASATSGQRFSICMGKNAIWPCIAQAYKFRFTIQMLMELDQKISYAVLAVGAASLVLAGLGLHAGVHFGMLDKGGVVDRFPLHR